MKMTFGRQRRTSCKYMLLVISCCYHQFIFVFNICVLCYSYVCLWLLCLSYVCYVLCVSDVLSYVVRLMCCMLFLRVVFVRLCFLCLFLCVHMCFLSSKDMQSRYVIKICNTYVQHICNRYATCMQHICNIYSKICNEDMQ